MDYFSNFRKRIVPAKVQPNSALHLVKFHKCWDYVHNIFDSDDNKTNVHVQQTEIPNKLRLMVDMLVDEEARQEEDSTTGVCMEYFLKNGVLHYLVSVAEKADYPVGIRGETIRMIANMVDLLDDRFLVHNAVHRPTVKLLRFCVLDQQHQYHEDLVDLMYIICSKIHGFPALLNIFFHHNPNNSNYDEFLLFTYLLRFVHREGRSGDYARTGLLFVMEMAAADHLGDFILSSDFATIMAAGLGALYSQLPRKLVVKDESLLSKTASTYLLGQDFIRLNLNHVDESSSSSFRYQLDAFLKLLEFCQDVLGRCSRTDICKALLQYIRAIFLENILYPSILECSDVDGSSVAVISYIDAILQTVEHNALADMIVGFLIDDDDDSGHSSPTSEVMNDTDKICSNLFAGLELDRYKSSTYFTAAGRFTLKDLIFSRLKSSSQPAVIATLKLLKTLLTKHCRYSLKLLSIYPDYGDDFIYSSKQLSAQPPRQPSSSTATATTVSHHIREIELYFSLISAIDQVHADDVQLCGYEGYLYDMEALMEGDGCFQGMCTGSSEHDDEENNTLAGHNNNNRPRARRRHSFKYGNRFAVADQQQQQKHDFPPRTYTNHLSSLKKLTLFKHRIQPTDPLLQILLGLLSNFFAQSSELNLVLTGVISALAMCPYRSLKGWISFRDSDRTSAEDVLVLNTDSEAVNLKAAATSNKAYDDDDDRIHANDIYHHPTVIPRSVENEDEDDDDDRSIDYGVEKQSAAMTQPTQFKSFPPFFTLFRTLTQQVDYYRSEIDNFDILLEERRLMLQNPQAAATLETFSSPSSPVPSTPTTPTTTSTMGSLSAAAGYLFGFSNPAPAPPLSDPSSYARRPSILPQQPSASSNNNNNNNNSDYYWWSARPDHMQSDTSGLAATEAAVQSLISDPLSPLSVHARRTQDIRIKPLFPSSFPQDNKDSILDLDDEDEDAFAPADQDPSIQARRRKSAVNDIPLSKLLNNVVILEESIKELIAVMQVRSSLGVDQIRYV
ncbi:Retinoic acid induced 16-like protein-domain-containing protein [Zychaea mexicana]|uniref:Retinoic acid induced 16-like protein-domain-containing protein n=1 Tax=Zychaea mexicana TaxID=64656 RepID=UPI0022FE01F4|nr:Retinoic acid induced 16-like protein-domain-containing protein [Zychaea mexicana]KAI9497641.1 Retinoic acid induced 16-like protein-domain-containing protein [Zychaea mexicana]